MPATPGFATEATRLGLRTSAAGSCGGELTRIVGSERSESDRNTTAPWSGSFLGVDSVIAGSSEAAELFNEVSNRRAATSDVRLALLDCTRGIPRTRSKQKKRNG